MITVFVQYKLKDGMTREQAHTASAEAAPRFRKLVGLERKYFLYHEDGVGGGFYVWQDRDKADAFYTDAWLDSMQQRMGSRPTVKYFETAVLVDNAKGEILVE